MSCEGDVVNENASEVTLFLACVVVPSGTGSGKWNSETSSKFDGQNTFA